MRSRLWNRNSGSGLTGYSQRWILLCWKWFPVVLYTPGPLFNATTNYSVVVRVFNHLDDPLLLTWSGPPGIQMQRHLWQDGLPGTHFLRDGTLLTSFRWKIKLEASALPYSTSREHLLSLVMLWLITGTLNLILFPQSDGKMVLRILLDYGKELGMPDGVLIMDSVLTSTAVVYLMELIT